MKNLWIIQAETNIHVGNENTSSVGLIDKEIQRDALTGIPCINASSLKGAMNEYATTEAKLSSAERLAIFGVDKNRNSDTQKGSCKFFDAQLLLLPVQDDQKLYRLVTSEETLGQFLSLLNQMGIDITFEALVSALKSVDDHFDGIKGDNNGIISRFSLFKEYCSDDELPIIARNSLSGNGNLWYEQILPRKCVFGTILIAEPSEVSVNNTTVNIEAALDKNFNGKIVQIGANATIGYGYCQFMKI